MERSAPADDDIGFTHSIQEFYKSSQVGSMEILNV